MLPGIDSVLESLLGGVLGLGEGGDDSQEELEEESEQKETTMSSSGYVVQDDGGSFEVGRWESTVMAAEGVDMGIGVSFFGNAGVWEHGNIYLTFTLAID